MRAIVTVIGKDHVGIIADVTALLAQYGVNVLDISQTVLQAVSYTHLGSFPPGSAPADTK